MKGYTIIEQIGKGGFAKVHKATKETVTYALKEIEQNDAIERYIQGELDIAKQKLKHRNIVQIFDYFTEAGIYIVMEYCEMGDLSSYLVQVKPDINRRIVFMTHMALGVNYLHNQNIIHHDLKPENVLLTNKAGKIVCKITDFGMSRVKLSPHDVFHTYIGSFPYMAPEITGDQEYGNEVDIFALGMLFYAVYKYTILTTSFGTQSLIPGLCVDGNRIAYLNEVMKREKPTIDQFIEKYFQDSNVVVGKFIFSMIDLQPENRPQMDFVLMQISEIKVNQELNPTIERQEQAIKDLQNQNEELTNELHKKDEKLQCIDLERSWNYVEQNMKSIRDLQEQNEYLTKELLQLREQSEAESEYAQQKQENLNMQAQMLHERERHGEELKQQKHEVESLNLQTQIDSRSLQVESEVGRLANQIREKLEEREMQDQFQIRELKKDMSAQKNKIKELDSVIKDLKKQMPKDAGPREGAASGIKPTTKQVNRNPSLSADKATLHKYI